jgi:hypothetical protein
MTIRQSAVAAAVVSSAIVALGSGGLVLLGLLIAGGLAASWGYVYVRVVCAAGPFVWSRMLRTAAVGALAMPAITVTAWLVGSGVWLLVAGVALAWVLLVTPDGGIALRSRVQRWLRVVSLNAQRLLDRG